SPVLRPAPPVAQRAPQTPSCPRPSIASDHRPIRLSLPSPSPRSPHFGRNRRSSFLTYQNRKTTCAAEPPTLIAAIATIISSVHRPGSPTVPHSPRNRAAPMIATRLLDTGAHWYGPKLSWAFSSCPDIKYRAENKSRGISEEHSCTDRP